MLIKSKLIVVFTLVFLAMNKQNILAQNDTKLEYQVRAPKGECKNPPLLVLLHGYGSNEQDLFSFSPNIPERWLVISVRAPHRMGNNAYKWYNVAMDAGKIKIDAKQEQQSRLLLGKFVGEIIEKFKVDTQKVVIAGFSQGAIMSLGLALTIPDSVSGFACFSGRFLDEIKLHISKSPNLKLLKAFVAHGNEDTMLPIKNAEESVQLLQTLGIAPIFVKDNVGHSISNKHFEEFLKWLKQF